jgi:hypothetical protein
MHKDSVEEQGVARYLAPTPIATYKYGEIAKDPYYEKYLALLNKHSFIKEMDV